MSDHPVLTADQVASLFDEGVLTVTVGLGTIVGAHRWRDGWVVLRWAGLGVRQYPPDWTFAGMGVER